MASHLHDIFFLFLSCILHQSIQQAIAFIKEFKLFFHGLNQFLGNLSIEQMSTVKSCSVEHYTFQSLADTHGVLSEN